jgi:outer membrane protein assembly factor BamA
MLSVIFGLFTLFSSGHAETNDSAQADSTKLPSKNRTALVDSAAHFVTINRIFIVGNRITRDQIVLRELTLKQGDIIYSSNLPEVLENDRKRLVNTRLFNTVDIRTLELETGRMDLLVNLNERWYTFPAPIFELADRNFNEWWENYNHDFRRVNYGLRLYQYNMRGRNETLRFTAQFGYVRRFEVSYRLPFIDRRQKHGLVIDFDYYETKNLPYRTFEHKLDFIELNQILRSTLGGGLTYTFRNSFYEWHAVKLDFRSNAINDTIQKLNPNYLGEGRLRQEFGTLSYQFTSDHRDYMAYPLKGYYLVANAAKLGLTSNDDVQKLEASVNYARFLDLKKGYYFSNNTIGYWSTPRDLAYFNYGALGYRKQIIRGYEVYVIEGPYYFLNKSTFKKKIFSRTYHWRAMPIDQFRHIPLSIYFKTYADVGYVRNYPGYTLGEPLTNKLLSGVGFGFDVVGSYDAVIRFEYTFNAEGNNGFFFHLKKEF